MDRTPQCTKYETLPSFAPQLPKRPPVPAARYASLGSLRDNFKVTRHNRSMPLPNSLPWMESVDAKMLRAHEHIEALGRASMEYLASIRIHQYLKTDPHLPNPWLNIVASDYIPPMSLSAMLGDCIHNMRAALDNLVCGLARTQDQFCTCKDTAFPYTRDPAGWNDSVQTVLKGVPKPAQKIIKSVQPWCDPTAPNPLLMLNKLSNIDKHRHCNFGLAYSRDTMFRIYCNDGRVLEIRPKESLYLGEFHSFPLPIGASLVAVGGTRVESSATLVITFQEEGPWSDMPTMQVLQNCFDYIQRNVIGPLTPFFRPAQESSAQV